MHFDYPFHMYDSGHVTCIIYLRQGQEPKFCVKIQNKVPTKGLE